MYSEAWISLYRFKLCHISIFNNVFKEKSVIGVTAKHFDASCVKSKNMQCSTVWRPNPNFLQLQDQEGFIFKFNFKQNFSRPRRET